MKKTIQHTKLALAVGAITLSSGQIHAESFALEEIVVTAQKRAESLQDTPVAISAFQGDDLENMGVGSTQQLQAVTPALTFNNRGAIAQPYIRGIGTTLSLLGLEPSVATYVDDQYYSRPGGNIMELPDIERIEVLKGPQGTLYGRNATGGAIRVVTKDPGDEFEGKVKLSAGNYDYYGLSAYVAGPIAENLSANFSALVKQRDGFAENQVPGGNDLDDLDVETYRTKWVWDASDTVTAKWSLDYTRREDTAGSETIDITSTTKPILGGSVAALLGQPVGKDQDKIYASADDANVMQMWNTSLRVDVALDGMEFSSITTYQDSRLDTKAGDFDTSALRLADVSDKETNKALSQEFQLVSDSAGPLNWVVGTYLFQSEGDYQLTLDARDLPAIGQILTSPESELDTTSWAVFGQATYDFNEAWSLTLGARYSEEKKEVETAGGNLMTGGPFNAVDVDETWEKFTPKATLEYNTDNGMYYLTYSTGFKSGGFAYPVVAEALANTTEAVDPETLDMWELGAKLDLLDNTLRVNAALYFYDYEDLQVNRNAGLVPPVGIVLPVENAKGAEVKGLEVDVTWLPVDQLVVSAGFNAMDTEYTDYDNATPNIYKTVAPGPASVVMPTAYDASGDDMVRAPDLSAYLGVEYTFHVGDASMPVNLTYSYKSEYDFDLMPGDANTKIDELESDSYTLLNARVSFIPASEEWSLSLWGSNLTDEEYFNEVVTFATGVRATVGDPRTYGVDFTYNF